MRGSRVSEVSLIGCLSRKHFFGFFGLRGVWTQPLAPLAPEEDAALPFTVPPTFFLPIKPRPARLFPNLEASSALSLSGCHCSLHRYSLKCSFVSSSFHMCECVWKPGPSWKRAHRSQQSIWGTGVRKLLLTVIFMPFSKQNKWCFTEPIWSIMNIHLTEEETARHTDNYPGALSLCAEWRIRFPLCARLKVTQPCCHAGSMLSIWNHPGLFHCSLKVKTRVGFDSVTKENPKLKWSYNTDAESPADLKFTLF